MIAIIDYDAGNLKSVEKALQSIGEDTIVSIFGAQYGAMIILLHHPR